MAGVGVARMPFFSHAVTVIARALPGRVGAGSVPLVHSTTTEYGGLQVIWIHTGAGDATPGSHSCVASQLFAYPNKLKAS